MLIDRYSKAYVKRKSNQTETAGRCRTVRGGLVLASRLRFDAEQLRAILRGGLPQDLFEHPVEVG
jgi:hypothetical protein